MILLRYYYSNFITLNLISLLYHFKLNLYIIHLPYDYEF
jgi:hypothetical protein